MNLVLLYWLLVNIDESAFNPNEVLTSDVLAFSPIVVFSAKGYGSVAMNGGIACANCSIAIGNLFCGNTTGHTVTINNVLKLVPATTPSNPTEGTIFSCSTDHHLYFYNGSVWKQLDNP